MSFVLHLRNVPKSVDDGMIRRHFSPLIIKYNGVTIVGGPDGDVFVDFQDEHDILKGMALEGQPINGHQVKYLLAKQQDKLGIIAKAITNGYFIPGGKTMSSSSTKQLSSKTFSAPPSPAKQAVVGSSDTYSSGWSSKGFRNLEAGSPSSNNLGHRDLHARSPPRHPAGIGHRDLDARSPSRADRSGLNWGPAYGNQASRSRPTTFQTELKIADNDDGDIDDRKKNAPKMAIAENPKANVKQQVSPGRLQMAAKLATELATQIVQGKAPTLPPGVKLPDHNLSNMNQIQVAAQIVKSMLMTPKSPIDTHSKPLPLAGNTKGPLMTAAAASLQAPTTLGKPPSLETKPSQQETSKWSPAVAASITSTATPLLGKSQGGMPLACPEVTQSAPASITQSQQENSLWGPLPPPVSTLTANANTQWSSTVFAPCPHPSNPSLPPEPLPLQLSSSSTYIPCQTASVFGVSHQPTSMGASRPHSKTSIAPPSISTFVTGAQVQKPMVACASTHGVHSMVGPRPQGAQHQLSAPPLRGAMPVMTPGRLPHLRGVAQPHRPLIQPAGPIKKPAEAVIIIKDSDDSDDDEAGPSKRPRKKTELRTVVKDKFGRDLARDSYSTDRRRSRSGSRDSRRSRSKDRRRSRSRDRRRSRSRERQRTRSRERQRSRSRERRSKAGGPRSSEHHRSRSPLRRRSRERERTPELDKRVDTFEMHPCSIRIENISASVTLASLRDFFKDFKIAVDGLLLVPSFKVGMQKGYVKFTNQKDAEKAQDEMNGRSLCNRKAVIRVCVRPTGHPPRHHHSQNKDLERGRNKDRQVDPSSILADSTPAGRESVFKMLGAGPKAMCHVSVLTGFPDLTTACSIWAWYNSTSGPVKGVMISYKVRHTDEKMAFLIFDDVDQRNNLKLPMHNTKISTDLRLRKYSERMTIQKILSDDVSILTESTMFGKDRFISKEEIERLENKFPEDLSDSRKREIKKRRYDSKTDDSQRDFIQENSQGTSSLQRTLSGGKFPNLDLWTQYNYICLDDVEKGTKASNVIPWFNTEGSQAKCVLLASCASENALCDGSTHVAFIGYQNTTNLRQLKTSKRISTSATMRFLANLPDTEPILCNSKFGKDVILTKAERDFLKEQYPPLNDAGTVQLELVPQPPIEFSLNDDFTRGTVFLTIAHLTAMSSANKLLDISNHAEGAILVVNPEGMPCVAHIGFTDAQVRNDIQSKVPNSQRGSWLDVLHSMQKQLNEGFTFYISTSASNDRPISQGEIDYLRQLDIPYNIVEDCSIAEHPITTANTVAVSAAQDTSDQLFYIRIRKLPNEISASKIWRDWFGGVTGYAKKTFLVCNELNKPICAYVGFDSEQHRDLAFANQRFSKAVTYKSFAMYLAQNTGLKLKVYEAHSGGTDRALTETDKAVIEYKAKQPRVEHDIQRTSSVLKRKHNECPTEPVDILRDNKSTIFFRLNTLRADITATEIWNMFDGIHGPTKCATLIRDAEGTALYSLVGFASGHEDYFEKLELGTFTLCGPKARDLELRSLGTEFEVIQSSKLGDQVISQACRQLFKDNTRCMKHQAMPAAPNLHPGSEPHMSSTPALDSKVKKGTSANQQQGPVGPNKDMNSKSKQTSYQELCAKQVESRRVRLATNLNDLLLRVSNIENP